MKWSIAVLILGVLVTTGWFLVRGDGDGDVEYRLVTVERGDVERLVTSTGTLGAVTTVEVGTQVSGALSRILVDYNDKVVKGQMIAQLDTTLLAIAVSEVEAGLAQATATHRHAGREYERQRTLREQQMVSETEFAEAQYQAEVAASALQSAQVRLALAKRNLAYATIYAPISGTVIERDVDVGQTVAASLSAPKLFVIANDLSKMQILVSVDESDIGVIRPDLSVRFTVQAYPEETFAGTVRQVRLQSVATENVVNYTVVVDVDNSSGKLLPGMTATVDFVIETATDVLKVANAALRFRPTEGMVAELRGRRSEEGEGVSAGDRPNDPGEARSAPAGSDRRGSIDSSRLFYVDGEGKVAVARVRTGISDGTYTVIEGDAIEAGMQVIAAATTAKASAAANPFTPQQDGPPRRGPGF